MASASSSSAGSPEARKAAGNERFSAGEYEEALDEYRAALSLLEEGDPQAPLIQSNMAAVYLKLRRAGDCVECGRAALAADPGSVKARLRLARGLAGSGGFREALEELDAVPVGSRHDALEDFQRNLEAAQAQLARADEAFEAGDHAAALEGFGALEGGVLFDCPELVARMGRCYLALGDVNRVLNVSAALLRRNSTDISAHLLRAEAQFQANVEHIDVEAWDRVADLAMKSTRQALSLDPEHRGAARLRRRLRASVDGVKEARAAMVGGAHARAAEVLTGLLESCDGASASTAAASGKFAARCHTERGRARLELGDVEGCIADCMAASRLDRRLTAAPVVEAQALQKQERWDDAVAILEGLYEWNKDNDVFWKLEWAKFEVRRVRRPNYYEALGLEPGCSFQEVKKNYLKLSAEYHPDKLSHKRPDMAKSEAEAKFKTIGEAYEFLGDPAKREFYDKGYDAQGIREVLSVRKRFAGQAACSQCGEDESGKLGADDKWYCLRCWDAYYRDKPGEDPDREDQQEPNLSGGGSSPSSASPRVAAGSASPSTNGYPAAPRNAPWKQWPADVPAPSPEEVERMGVADLKTVLRRLQVDAAGCLTKDDLRACARGALGEVPPPWA